MLSTRKARSLEIQNMKDGGAVDWELFCQSRTTKQPFLKRVVISRDEQMSILLHFCTDKNIHPEAMFVAQNTCPFSMFKSR